MSLERRFFRVADVLFVLVGLVAGCAGSTPGPRQANTPLPEDAREVRVEAKLTQRTIDFVDDLPRTETGKMAKRRLRSRYWEGHDGALV